MRPRSFAVKAALLIVVLLLHVTAAYADDVVVMTSGAFTAAYLELAKGFESVAYSASVSGDIAAGSKHTAAARALIRFLASPAASSTVVKSGMEPITAK